MSLVATGEELSCVIHRYGLISLHSPQPSQICLSANRLHTLELFSLRGSVELLVKLLRRRGLRRLLDLRFGCETRHGDGDGEKQNPLQK